MKFHNAQVGIYNVWMSPAAPRTLLARLRTSARLAVLVLLVFAMKIGVAAACAKHEFADLGLGTDGSHTAVMKAPSTDGGDTDLTKTKLGHASACSCSCHHATTTALESNVAFTALPQELVVRSSGLPPSAALPQELRPPIV